MIQHDKKSFQLFDLLAREWELPSSIEGAVFNNNGTAVAVACSDGLMFILETEDPESPNTRLHLAVDTGQQSIRPRKGDFPPVQKVECPQKRTSSIVPYGATGFLFGTENGQLAIVTSQGAVKIIDPGKGEPIIAVAASSDSTMLSFAAANDIMVCNNEVQESLFEFKTVAPVVALDFSPDGLTLAVAHKGGISTWQLAGNTRKQEDYPLACPPNDICWSVDGLWIACSLSSSGFFLINTRTQLTKLFPDFPTAVNSLSFSGPANAIASSGAFRAAAWSLPHLQNRDGNDGALTSGKPGLVAVDCVAASPTKNILAVGYANGLLSLTQIGQQEEMLLAQGNGVGISVLTWSKSGNYLVIGRANGKTALVEFPQGMFK